MTKRNKQTVRMDSTIAVLAAEGRRSQRKQRQAELRQHRSTVSENMRARGFESSGKGNSKYAKKKAAQRRAA